MQVSLTNPATNQVKVFKIGWSWTVFFFAGFFGIPLFIRHLYALGSLCISLYVVQLLFLVLGAGSNLFALLWIVITIWLASVSNKMAVAKFLKEGWAFTDQNSVAAQFVKK